MRVIKTDAKGCAKARGIDIQVQLLPALLPVLGKGRWGGPSPEGERGGGERSAGERDLKKSCIPFGLGAYLLVSITVAPSVRRLGALQPAKPQLVVNACWPE